MTKRLIEIDDHLLEAARGRLGTTTIKDTVGRALQLAATDRDAQVDEALEVLTRLPLADRSEAWR